MKLILRPLKKLLKNWRLKAALFRIMACLPEDLASKLHYLAQTRLGSLRSLEPWTRFGGAVKASQFLANHGREVQGARVLEIGTGWRLNAPLALSLMGAELVVTVDLRRFLRPELVLSDLRSLVDNEDSLRKSLGDFPLHERRWAYLRRVVQSQETLTPEKLEENLGILYLAPQDASRLGDFDDESFDLHFSQNTFEHIPPEILTAIMTEATRLLGARGLAVHFIDQSDHFSHFDPKISSANFLQYTDRQWNRLAGNRFTYVNRLRAPEYRRLFQQAGFQILNEETEVDPKALQLVREGALIPAPGFTEFSAEELATRNSWLVAAVHQTS